MRIKLLALSLLIFSGCMQYTTEPSTPPSVLDGNNSNEANQEVSIKIPLIALEDQGKSGEQIGCGDSLVFVDRNIMAKEEEMLQKAYSELLSIKEETYGESGLYNTLAKSNLTIESITTENRKATVKLSGTYTLGGACDNPRFQAQLEKTALQFDTIDEVYVTINDVPLDQIVSGK